MSEIKKANRLIHATSPYLLQHAYNPVDWFEWGEEALSKAIRENKPLLVSIGYSSCHWCHVMEREVFEKDDIARIMNEYLVCIKVDREERPDIDSIYMEAVQAMGVHGGWPLNVFLTPDQKPFYGGTYFPPDQWVNVLRGVHKGFTERRSDVDASATELATLLASQDTSHFKKVYEFTSLKTDLDAMFSKLASAFDRNWGGLDKAPKFIMPSVWLWMLRYYKITGNAQALHHLNITLHRIAWGGIYDQIGGGFARYSVDAYWFVPHFEKMLYDNAQLMTLYAEAFAATKEEIYRTVLIETFEWLQGEMMHPDGGFYSALDADSEGVEGKFYVWTKAEIEEVLKTDAPLFTDFYNIKPEGNWEHGNNVLIRTQTDTAFLQKHGLTRQDWEQKLKRCKERLLEVRDKRIRPGLDDKIITSWNAMTAAGLVDAYKYLGDPRFLQAALKNMQFLERELIQGDIVFRSYKDKRSGTKGFLDDYAYLIQAAIKLYEVTFDRRWITLSERLMIFVLDHFLDQGDGFFFYTSDASEKLIARRKEIFDNVIPASNSVMVQNLFRLGTILDNEEWKRLAESITTPLAHLIISEPNYMSNWGIAYTEIKHGLAEVVLAGDHASKTLTSLFVHYLPFVVTLASAPGNELPLTKGKTAIDGRDTIYVCFDKTCQRPVHDIAEAVEQIEHAHQV
ncbi:MAG TPA: thioredoxin domain-containing protein [Chryseosolibacter sp.]|nr:thioredoxin domain-containing protein [Chryseosolibacter sp.]